MRKRRLREHGRPLTHPAEVGASRREAPVKAADDANVQTAGTAPAAPSWRTWAAVGLLLATVCAAYANSLHGPFIFDDEPSIIENQSIRHLGSPQVLAAPPDALTTTGRPVVNLSLAVNYAIGGLAVEGYHVVNLALHLLAALVLFALLRRALVLPTLSGQFGAAATGLALTVSLLWAIHPLQTESVTYIVQRAEAIVGLFYFLTLYCFLRGATAKRGSAWYVAAVATCALGMASKEVMVSAPLLAVLFDRTFVAGSFKASLRRRWGLWLAMASTWVLLAFLHHLSRDRGGSAGFGLGVTAWMYARTQFGCIIHYLRLAFWPSPLVLDCGRFIAHRASEIVPSAIAVLALIVATAVGLALRPKWGFLGAWFLAILAPTSSIVPLPGQTEAEHRMYLPLAAVVALVVLPAYRATLRLGPRARRAMAALVPVVAVVLGLATHQRNKDYQSELAIWDDTIRNCPRNDRAYLTRGSVYWTSDQTEAALKDYDQCLSLNSRNAECYLGRGNIYLAKGRYDEAASDYDKALELKPDLAEAHNGRGEIFGFKGQVGAAMKEFDRAIALAPRLAQAHYNRANIFYAMGDLDASIRGYDQVIRLRADYSKAYNSRGIAYDNKGQGDAAIRDYDKAIALQPDFAEAYSNRCSALDAKGQGDAAIRDCDKAIALRPDFAEAYGNRGNILQGKGQYEAAIRDYDKAIALRPDFLAAYQNRAMARCQSKAYDQAWADVKMVRRLGGTPIPGFVEDLAKKSGRSE
jgi:tetratricopeptide (TPR) repeat protein